MKEHIKPFLMLLEIYQVYINYKLYFLDSLLKLLQKEK